MLLLPPRELGPLLCIMLTLLTIHATIKLPEVEAPVIPIVDALEEDHDLPSELGRAVMSLSGELQRETWKVDARRMVVEVGRGLLASLKSDGIALDLFLGDWREQVGETWAELIDVKFLEVSYTEERAETQGDYLINIPTTLSHTPTIISFPAHSLPLHPITRFADLFLTRPRWRPEDMAPFVRGLTRDGDTKERDKLVAKFVRVVKEKEGIWWYPRRTS